MDLTNEISDAISNPVGMGNMIDEVRLLIWCCKLRISLTCRTSSTQSWKLWSRKNWTIDWQVQTGYRFIPLHHPSAYPTALLVSRRTLIHSGHSVWSSHPRRGSPRGRGRRRGATSSTPGRTRHVRVQPSRHDFPHIRPRRVVALSHHPLFPAFGTSSRSVSDWTGWTSRYVLFPQTS